MALPLLMLAGAGILGGSQYLLKKQDQKRADGMFGALQSQMQNSALPPMIQDSILARGQDMIANDSFWNRSMVSSQLDQLSNNAMVANNNYVMQQQEMAQQMKIASGQAQRERSFQLANEVEADYNRDLKDFGTFQDSYAKGVRALESNSSADAMAAVYNFFNLVEPGGIVRDGETAQFRDVGGTKSKIVNLLNGIQGKGLDPRAARELQTAMRNQYLDRYGRAKRQRDYYQERIDGYRSAGYDVWSPVGSLGIDYGYNPDPTGGQMQPRGPIDLTRPQPTKQLIRDAGASMDATLDSIDPGGIIDYWISKGYKPVGGG